MEKLKATQGSGAAGATICVDKGVGLHESRFPLADSSQVTALHRKESRQLSKSCGKNSEEYEVERVLDMRDKIGVGVQFLIKWKGFDESFNTWEPEENCRGAEKKIKNFLRNRQAADVTEQKNAAPAVKKAKAIESFTKVVNGGNGRSKSHSTEIGSSAPARSSSAVRNPVGTQQKAFDTPEAGYTGIELGKLVVGIIAHKPARLVIEKVEDICFLINYADHPQEFVSYELCREHITHHLCEYLASHPVMFFQRTQL